MLEPPRQTGLMIARTRAGRDGYLHEQFLKLDYFDVEKKRIRFGSAILKMDSNGDRLTGRFLGYSSEFEGLTWGEAELKRV